MRLPSALLDLLRPAALFAALGVLIAPGAPLPAGPAAPAVASQCRAGEAVIYSCRFGTPARPTLGSVCGSARTVHYRFGAPGSPGLDLASAADWSNVHTGTVRGQGGGYQEHVRFTNGTTDYIVFRGEDGALASRPGRTYSGIAVQGPGTDRTLACTGAARIGASLVAAVGARAPADAALDEVPDGPFDAWF